MIIAKYGKQEKGYFVGVCCYELREKIVRNIIGHSKLSLIYKMRLCYYEIVPLFPDLLKQLSAFSKILNCF